MNVRQYAEGLPLHQATPTRDCLCLHAIEQVPGEPTKHDPRCSLYAAAPDPPFGETLSEKLARLERENAALLARAEDAEKGWHDALAKRVPVEPRNGVDILITQQTLLEEILTELRHSNSTAREGAVSSVAIEDMAKGPPKITTKMYQGSPLSAEDLSAVLAAHSAVHEQAEQLAMAGWKMTSDALAEAAKAAGQ